MQTTRIQDMAQDGFCHALRSRSADRREMSAARQRYYTLHRQMIALHAGIA